MLFALLEQFQILALLNLKIFGLDFSVTNFFIINILSLLTIIFIIFCNSANNLDGIFLFNSNLLFVITIIVLFVWKFFFTIFESFFKILYVN